MKHRRVHDFAPVHEFRAWIHEGWENVALFALIALFALGVLVTAVVVVPTVAGAGVPL